MIKISCIIPAYNEAQRIHGVLEVIASHPFIHEIIVVDDGSHDNTSAVVSEFKKVRLVTHKSNSGKTKALYTGITESTGDFLFFLDSDLSGLKTEDITNLIAPVQNNLADISISLRRNAPRVWKMIGMDYISGERILPKKILLPHLKKMLSLPRFGIEVFLNSLIIRDKLRIAIVSWPEVDSPYKNKKMGLLKGLKADFFMMIDIFRTISIFGPIYQIIKMNNLKIKI